MTPKQAKWYGEYIKDFNGARAARAIGVPEKSAAVFAARMLRNDKVSAAVDAWRKRQCEKQEITAERILNELMKLAVFDPGNLYDEDGNQIPVAKLDDVTRAAIASVEDECTQGAPYVTTRKQKVKFADKGLNLERLGRYLKLFTDRVEHDGRVTLEQLVCGGESGGSGERADS